MSAIVKATVLANNHMNLVRDKFTLDTSPDHVRQVAIKHITRLPYTKAVGDDGLDWETTYTVWELQLGKELAEIVTRKSPGKVHTIRKDAKKKPEAAAGNLIPISDEKKAEALARASEPATK